MYLHIGAFTLATISIISLESVIYHYIKNISIFFSYTNNTYDAINNWVIAVTTTIMMSTYGTFLSTGALLIILNGLINKSLETDV